MKKEKVKKQLQKIYGISKLLSATRYYIGIQESSGLESLEKYFEILYPGTKHYFGLVYYFKDEHWDGCENILQELCQAVKNEFLDVCREIRNDPKMLRDDLYKIFFGTGRELCDEVYEEGKDRLDAFLKKIAEILFPVQADLGCDFWTEFFVMLRLDKIWSFVDILKDYVKAKKIDPRILDSLKLTKLGYNPN